MKDTPEPLSGSTANSTTKSHSENENSHLESASPVELFTEHCGPDLKIFFVTSTPNRPVPIRRHRRPKNRIHLSRQRRNTRRIAALRSTRS